MTIKKKMSVYVCVYAWYKAIAINNKRKSNRCLNITFWVKRKD